MPEYLCRYCGKLLPSELSSKPCPGSPDQQHRYGQPWNPPPPVKYVDYKAAWDRLTIMLRSLRDDMHQHADSLSSSSAIHDQLLQQALAFQRALDEMDAIERKATSEASQEMLEWLARQE